MITSICKQRNGSLTSMWRWCDCEMTELYVYRISPMLHKSLLSFGFEHEAKCDRRECWGCWNRYIFSFWSIHVVELGWLKKLKPCLRLVERSWPQPSALTQSPAWVGSNPCPTAPLHNICLSIALPLNFLPIPVNKQLYTFFKNKLCGCAFVQM